MEELVEKARKGDKEAFTTLILSLEKDLYKIAKVRLKNDDDIYDVLQETIIIAFKSVKNLRKTQYFKPWIIKILVNQSNAVYRQKYCKKIISFEDIEDTTVDKIYDLENIELTLDFNLLCNKLAYEDRIIIILYYMEKFTDKEIGKILNLKENTVKTKRVRAKQKIKNILKLGGKYDG